VDMISIGFGFGLAAIVAFFILLGYLKEREAQRYLKKKDEVDWYVRDREADRRMIEHRLNKNSGTSPRHISGVKTDLPDLDDFVSNSPVTSSNHTSSHTASSHSSHSDCSHSYSSYSDSGLYSCDSGGSSDGGSCGGGGD